MADSTTTTTSGQWSLNVKDALRGFIVAALTAAITAVYNIIQTGTLEKVDWKAVGGIALAAGLAYIIKNLLQPQTIVIENPSKAEVKAVQDGHAEATVTPKEPTSPPINYTSPKP